MQTCFYVGHCAIGIDPRTLGLLRETGIREGIAEELEHIADARHHDRRPSRSFMNYLGLGCVFYEDLDEV